ncbi:MAG: hypothetical protein ACQEQK_04375 [Thermodesulfobacteriota bacterium]
MARALIVISVWLCLCCSALASSLEEYYEQRRENGVWQEVSSAECHALEFLLPKMLEGALLPEDIEFLGRLGWNWTPLADGRFILHEQQHMRFGRGLYLFDPEVDNSLFLQLPHSIYDLDTGDIGLKLAQHRGFKIIGWNTLQRYSHADADLAHRTGTPFHAMTLAFIRHTFNGRVVQIHGFSSSKRTTAAGKSAEIILSTGSSTACTPGISQLQECLRENLGLSEPEGIACYPEDIQELGATTNDQGQHLRRLGQNHFWHIELNRHVRRLLLRDNNMLHDLHECILQREQL